MPDPAERDEPLNLDLIGYDELGRLPIVGRASDRELFTDLPIAPFTAPAPVPRQPSPREFLSQDFGAAW